MPNYETHFCSALYVSSVIDFGPIGKIYDAFYEESEIHGHELEFAVSYVSGPSPHILLTDNDGTGTIEHVRAFVFECAEALNLDGTWALQWAETCSRPRSDGFGGGVILLDLGTRNTLFFDSTHSWLEDQVAIGQNAAAGRGFDWRTRHLEKTLTDLCELAERVMALGVVLQEDGVKLSTDTASWIGAASSLQAMANLGAEALMRRHRAVKVILEISRALLARGTVQPVFNAFVVTNDRHAELAEPEIVTRLRQAVIQLEGH